MRKFQKVILFIVFFISKTLYAQLYSFKTYNTNRGLGNSTINAIHQSNEGYIWFATQGGGLSRFDGKTFKNFTKEDGLISNDITAVYEDDQHNVWIGSIEGLTKFNGKTFKNYTEKDGLGKYTVYGINKNKDGTIWVSTFGAGVKIFKNGKLEKSLDTTNCLPTNNVFCTLEDKDGSTWVGMYYEGLSNISKDGKKIKQYKNFNTDLKDCSAFSLAQSKDGDVWVGSAGQGLFRIKNRQVERIEIKSIERDLIGKIIEDKFGNIWVAADNGLIRINKTGNYKLYTEKEGLSTNRIQTLEEDYEGNIWIGTYGGGVCMFHNEAIVSYTQKDGLSDSKIYAVCNTTKGILLAGSSKGLDYFNGEKFEKVNIKPLDNVSITFIHEDRKGNIWVATESEGLMVIIFNGKTFEKIKEYKNIGNTAVQPAYKIVEDKNGVVWVSTFGNGLFKFSETQAIEVKDEGLTTNDLSSLYFGKDNVLYVAAVQNRVFKYDGKSFSALENAPSTLSTVFSITGNEKGDVFFGTPDGGIIAYSKGKFTSINVKSGICSNLINGIDYKDGNLWIGTDKGVNRIELTSDLKPESINYYDNENGFVSNEINQNGVFIDNNKNIWFCTNGGITKYTPVLDIKQKVQPKLILEEIKLYNTSVNWEKYTDNVNKQTGIPTDLNLSYDKNYLTFSFVACHFTEPRKTKYKYMLRGFEEDFLYTEQREIVYSNIPPGDYEFIVYASTDEKNWSKNSITFKFNISPPFWKTWWFYLFCLFILGAGIYSYVKIRISSKKIKQQKELLQVHQKEISDSINYARRIQFALLASDKLLKNHFPDYFICFNPKDVVSGDFYWAAPTENGFIFVTADCTGHGVPGAFMSLLIISKLGQIINENKIYQPNLILNNVREEIIKALNPAGAKEECKDGMDVVLYKLNLEEMTLEYSTANNSFYIVRNKELIVCKGDKMPVGKSHNESISFTNHVVKIETGDMIYSFTDGYADQFGGPKGKKFKYKQMEEMLLSICEEPLIMQSEIIFQKFNTWKGNLEQIDDVCLIGVKV